MFVFLYTCIYKCLFTFCLSTSYIRSTLSSRYLTINLNLLFHISFIVQEISKIDYDYVLVPSNTPTFIQDLVRYLIGKTIFTEQTRNCLPSVNNHEATALEAISDGHRFVKERSQFQLQKAAFMSIAIFKELKWRLSVIFFDNLYGKKMCTAPNKFHRTIDK